MASKLVARSIVMAIAIALLVGGSSLVADAKGRPAKVDPALLADAKADPNGLFQIIVRGAPDPATNANAERSKKAQDVLARAGAEGPRRTLSIVGGASASLRGSQIITLSQSALVERVVRDQTFTATWTADDAAEEVTAAGILATNAPQAWSQLGASGKGVGVAVMDSGVADHPDLTGRIVARVDLTGEASAGDPGGHGTHVAGLIAGDGAASKGAWPGIAPQANIVSVRVIDSTGHAKLSWIVGGMQWVLANRSTFNIKVTNMSFGGTALSSYQNDLVAAAAEMLNFAGLTVVVSAGNAGSGASTITTPANDPFVLSVGASDDNATPGLADDTIALWSSRGPTAFDGIAKPDLVAPGRKIIGLRSAGSTLDTLYPERRMTVPGALSPQYFVLSGTSMSAPMVAGVAALVLERTPSMSPLAVKQQLMRTAHPLAGVPPTQQGAGVVDALAALRTVPQPVTYSPYPAAAAFAQQVYLKIYGQPIVWRDLTFHGGVDSRGVRWQDITWVNITWDDITWEDITWEAFSWLDITWDAFTWQDITWERAN